MIAGSSPYCCSVYGFVQPAVPSICSAPYSLFGRPGGGEAEVVGQVRVGVLGEDEPGGAQDGPGILTGRGEDVDGVILRAVGDDEPFVIGEEPPVRDERSGVVGPSLCNAVMLSEPGSEFARTWLSRMGAALNGTWSNHSGYLARALANELPDAVRVVPERMFFPFPCTPDGLDAMLTTDGVVPDDALTLHLCAHLWWHPQRSDFCSAHAGTLTVVCDRNNIQTMPASAAGRAVMIMKGSSQDWKLTTINR